LAYLQAVCKPSKEGAECEYLNKICLNIRALPDDCEEAKKAHLMLRTIDLANETTPLFVHPEMRPEFHFSCPQSERLREVETLVSSVSALHAKINDRLATALSIQAEAEDNPQVDYFSHYFGQSFGPSLVASAWLGYLIGCALGRWDIHGKRIKSSRKDYLHWPCLSQC
jgi:hypothetical protein